MRSLVAWKILSQMPREEEVVGSETFYRSRLLGAFWRCAMKEFHVNGMIINYQTSAENVFALDSYILPESRGWEWFLRSLRTTLQPGRNVISRCRRDVL